MDQFIRNYENFPKPGSKMNKINRNENWKILNLIDGHTGRWISLMEKICEGGIDTSSEINFKVKETTADPKQAFSVQINEFNEKIKNLKLELL